MSEADILKKIHYPECWDTMTYPTIWDALSETLDCLGYMCHEDACCFKCGKKLGEE